MKHTQDPVEKENLRLALDAMRVSGLRGWACCANAMNTFSWWELNLYPRPGVCVREPALPLPHPQDLAQCVNEVKRDNETLRQITNFQLSIENLVRGWSQARRARGVVSWGRSLVPFLVVLCQTPCLLHRTSL